MQSCSGNLCAKFHTLSFTNNLEKSGILPVGFPSFLVNLSLLARCTIKIFRGSGKGWWMGRGSSERCLKWGGGGGGSLRDLSKNILKQGVGKGKSCS